MNKIPQIGLGTFKLKGADGQKAIETALEIGYRHIDTAGWYKNHDIVGRAIKNSGVKRSDLYLVTKIPPPFSQEKILDSGPRYLEELQTDYIDLLLVHWPDANPVTEVLKSFARLREKGITKQIGVSNFSLWQMEEAIDAGFDIYNHQFEIYPGNLDQEMLEFCRKNKITVTSYSPFAQGKIFRNPKLKKIAEKTQYSPSQIILAWLMGQGIVVIPKSENPDRLRENFESTDINLSEEITREMNDF